MAGGFGVCDQGVDKGHAHGSSANDEVIGGYRGTHVAG
jgi:hypothetical protein